MYVCALYFVSFYMVVYGLFGIFWSISTLLIKTILTYIKKVAEIASGDRRNYPLFPFETDRRRYGIKTHLMLHSQWTMGVVWLNPLNSKSDQHLVSPNNYTTESFI